MDLYVKDVDSLTNDKLFEDKSTPYDVLATARTKAAKKLDISKGQANIVTGPSNVSSTDARRQPSQTTRRKSSSDQVRRAAPSKSAKQQADSQGNIRPALRINHYDLNELEIREYKFKRLRPDLET